MSRVPRIQYQVQRGFERGKWRGIKCNVVLRSFSGRSFKKIKASSFSTNNGEGRDGLEIGPRVWREVVDGNEITCPRKKGKSKVEPRVRDPTKGTKGSGPKTESNRRVSSSKTLFLRLRCQIDPPLGVLYGPLLTSYLLLSLRSPMSHKSVSNGGTFYPEKGWPLEFLFVSREEVFPLLQLHKRVTEGL